MITIDWNGKIGYGDIISPICYAYTQAQKNKTPVQLNMFWPHRPGEKFKRSDCQTLDEKFNYLIDNVKATNVNVTINQIFQKVDFNHTEIVDEHLPYHNFWYAEEHNQYVDSDYILINTTEHNAQQFEEYSPYKKWKDPIGVDRFNQIGEYIESTTKKDVIFVDQSMSIDILAKLYRDCFMAIGYHGSTMWLARYLLCPMVIFSSKEEVTKTSFPWAQHFSSVVTDCDYELLRDISIKQLKDFRNEYTRYLATPNLHRIRSKRIPSV